MISARWTILNVYMKLNDFLSMYLSARGKQSAKNINVKAKTKASALLAVQVDVCLLFFVFEYIHTTNLIGTRAYSSEGPAPPIKLVKVRILFTSLHRDLEEKGSPASHATQSNNYLR